MHAQAVPIYYIYGPYKSYVSTLVIDPRRDLADVLSFYKTPPLMLDQIGQFLSLAEKQLVWRKKYTFSCKFPT